MRDFTIDCQTFLRLTGADFGDYGSYCIGADGVGSTRTVESIESCLLIDATEAAALLDCIKDAELVFPATAAKLIEWVDQQAGEFVLPDWFRSLATAGNTDVALLRLREARNGLAVKMAEHANRLSSATAVDRDEDKLAQLEVEAELEALESLQKQLGAADAAARGDGLHDSKRPRFDPISVEIGLALEKLGAEATATQIMSELRSVAGKDGSSVTGVAGDGVTWKRGNGSPEKLAVAGLQKRIERLRKANPTTKRR